MKKVLSILLIICAIGFNILSSPDGVRRRQEAEVAESGTSQYIDVGRCFSLCCCPVLFFAFPLIVAFGAYSDEDECDGDEKKNN